MIFYMPTMEKNYYQVYSFKDNVNASLSEALSVNAFK